MFDLDYFEADFAYTVDGDYEGEVAYENFNAASAVFTIKGVNVHPGEAKDIMVNAALVGCEIAAALPANETPATPALEAETVRLLREYGFDSSNCVITSQSYETLHKVKALAPEYPTGYILALGVGNYYDLPDADFFSVETTFITSGMVNAVHLRGKTVSAWTIDREKVATHMLELGVDDLITDKPDMVQDLLARNQQVDDSLIDFRDLLNALLHPEQPADFSDDAEETITDAVEDPEEFVDAA